MNESRNKFSCPHCSRKNCDFIASHLMVNTTNCFCFKRNAFFDSLIKCCAISKLFCLDEVSVKTIRGDD